MKDLERLGSAKLPRAYKGQFKTKSLWALNSLPRADNINWVQSTIMRVLWTSTRTYDCSPIGFIAASKCVLDFAIMKRRTTDTRSDRESSATSVTSTPAPQSLAPRSACLLRWLLWPTSRWHTLMVSLATTSALFPFFVNIQNKAKLVLRERPQLPTLAWVCPATPTWTSRRSSPRAPETRSPCR